MTCLSARPAFGEITVKFALARGAPNDMPISAQTALRVARYSDTVIAV
jgi:hypothetical protein